MDEERKAPAVADGVVPLASWWSDREVSRYAPPGGAPRSGAASRRRARRRSPSCRAWRRRREAAADDRAREAHASKDNLLIVTYVNANRLDFVYTFVKHLIALGQRHYPSARSTRRRRGLQARGIPCFFMDSGLTTNDYGWGTYAFRQLGLHKVQLVLDLAKTGVDALTVDADAFVLRDPAAYFNALPDADVLMSSDHLTGDQRLRRRGARGPRRLPLGLQHRVHLHPRARDRVRPGVARHVLQAIERLGPGALRQRAAPRRRRAPTARRADRLMPMYKTSEGAT